MFDGVAMIPAVVGVNSSLLECIFTVIPKIQIKLELRQRRCTCKIHSPY